MRFKMYLKLVVLSIIIVIAVSNCSPHKSTPSVSTSERLKAYIDTIKVINTHEHQRKLPEFEGKKHNFYTILASSYLKSDIISSGAPAFQPDIINRGDLNELWNMYGTYLDFTRNTSYYSQFQRGFKVLYSFNPSYFTKESIQTLSDSIAAHYQDYDRWYAEAFQKAHFSTMFVDQYWDPFNTELDQRYFTLVFHVNALVTAAAQRSELTKKDAPVEINPYKLAEQDGFAIKTLDDYLGYAGQVLKQYIEHKAVCMKNSLAYSRSLDFEYVPIEKARALFARSSDSLSDSERKALQDFMFNWFITKAIETGLPVQIHTGYLAGNGNTLENSRPTKLNSLFLRYPKATFILFHGGYPWTGECAALAKMFPNVYLDLVWLPQISREAAIRGFDEMLDCVPYDKFFWGGDCHCIEESVGSLEFGKDVVAYVLGVRVDRGLMTEEVARDIALKLFRENALRVFELKKKLGRDL